MNKMLLLLLLVVLLAGGGIAFAQTGAGNALFGLQSVPPEIVYEEEGRELGDVISQTAQEIEAEIDLDKIISEEAEVAEVAEVARASENREMGTEIGGEERSEVAEEARASENREMGTEIGGEERSEVAEAVLGVLGNGNSPEDGSKFGEAVSSQARENGRGLGEAVSEAARNANQSIGAGNR